MERAGQAEEGQGLTLEEKNVNNSSKDSIVIKVRNFIEYAVSKEFHYEVNIKGRPGKEPICDMRINLRHSRELKKLKTV